MFATKIRLARFEYYALKRVRVPDSLERNGLVAGKNDVCNANNEYPWSCTSTKAVTCASR